VSAAGARRIAITGANGLVGRALARRWPAAVAFSHEDLDITDRAATERVLAGFDLVFNCAVTGVDECERDPALARAVNVDGPANVAACVPAIVHFSTNYVFAGDEEKLYAEDDPPSPVNVYGATKWEGERAVAGASSRAFIVRTSWVYGPGKENFLGTVAAKLRAGERVRAIGDRFASCTYVEDLVEAVAAIVARHPPGTFHAVNDGVVSYETFAREAARLVGADASLIETVSEAGVMRAPRPRYTPMRPSLPMRSWQAALADYTRRSAGKETPGV
jgi:dTDP-4-dehydrorhamnose reductase